MMRRNRPRKAAANSGKSFRHSDPKQRIPTLHRFMNPGIRTCRQQDKLDSDPRHPNISTPTHRSVSRPKA